MSTRADLANSEVVTLVKKLARDHHSSALAQLASRIAVVVRYGASAGGDPFGKVKGLISEMIVKLEKEAESEATEKAYCDEQTAKTQAEMDKLRAEENANFKVAKAELQQGLGGVQKALGVLREYYGSAAFLQESEQQPAAPQQHAKSSGAGGSIINILEVCESDFATNLAKEESEEQ